VVEDEVVVTIRCLDRKFSNIKAIIFDKDGTLEDSSYYLRELGIKRARFVDAQVPGVGEPLLMAFGIQDGILDPEGLMAVGSRRENEIAAATYIAETGKSWYEAGAIAQDAFHRADQVLRSDPQSPIAAPIFKEAIATLQALSQAGLKLAILSAARTDSIRAFVERHHLQSYFQVLLGSDGELGKPDPQFFLTACDHLGVAPEQALMVGDAQGDITMAKTAGAAAAIGISWNGKFPKALEQADLKITRLNSLQIVQSEN
jgi:phosphoglycolate phosphatase